MAAKKKTAKKTAVKRTAAELAAEAILKKFKMKPLTDHSGSYPAVPTGSVMVDDLIGGTLSEKGQPICLGFPRKRISEVYGAESSGKTTMALHAIAEVQRQGGTAMFLDFEYAIHHGYAKAIGVDFSPKRLIVYQPDTMEQGFQLIFAGVMLGVDLIVVDSVAAMVPKSELDKGISDAATIGATARLMSQNLPKAIAWMNNEMAVQRNPLGTALLFINQTRSTVNTGGGKARGNNETTSGGKALKFYASLRLQATRLRSEIKTRKDKFTGKDRRLPIGNHTQVKVTKNKMDGKQGHATDIFIRYGFGIDDYYSIIEAAVTFKLVKKRGGWYDFDGESYNGRDKLRSHLRSDPKVFDALRKKVLSLVQENASDADDSDDEQMSEEEALMQELQSEYKEVEVSDEDVPEDLDVDVELPDGVDFPSEDDGSDDSDEDASDGEGASDESP